MLSAFIFGWWPRARGDRRGRRGYWTPPQRVLASALAFASGVLMPDANREGGKWVASPRPQVPAVVPDRRDVKRFPERGNPSGNALVSMSARRRLGGCQPSAILASDAPTPSRLHGERCGPYYCKESSPTRALPNKAALLHAEVLSACKEVKPRCELL